MLRRMSRSNWSSKRTGPTSAQRTSPWPSYETLRPTASASIVSAGKSVWTSGATCTHCASPIAARSSGVHGSPTARSSVVLTSPS